jgi:hypothetical protein
MTTMNGTTTAMTGTNCSCTHQAMEALAAFAR